MCPGNGEYELQIAGAHPLKWLSCMVSTMGADDLAKQCAKAPDNR